MQYNYLQLFVSSVIFLIIATGHVKLLLVTSLSYIQIKRMAEIRCFDWGIRGKWQMQQKLATMIYETYMRVEEKKEEEEEIKIIKKIEGKDVIEKKTDEKWNKE